MRLDGEHSLVILSAAKNLVAQREILRCAQNDSGGRSVSLLLMS